MIAQLREINVRVHNETGHSKCTFNCEPLIIDTENVTYMCSWVISHQPLCCKDITSMDKVSLLTVKRNVRGLTMLPFIIYFIMYFLKRQYLFYLLYLAVFPIGPYW